MESMVINKSHLYYITLPREKFHSDLDLNLQNSEYIFILVQDNIRDLKNKYIFNIYT